jgi:hypothetical protein
MALSFGKNLQIRTGSVTFTYGLIEYLLISYSILLIAITKAVLAVLGSDSNTAYLGGH